MATPSGSEADALECWMRYADWLYDEAKGRRIKEKAFVRAARQLDQVPGAGEYFRHLCANGPSQLRLDKLIAAPSDSHKIIVPVTATALLQLKFLRS